jgi:hypothetical protein
MLWFGVSVGFVELVVWGSGLGDVSDDGLGEGVFVEVGVELGSMVGEGEGVTVGVELDLVQMLQRWYLQPEYY